MAELFSMTPEELDSLDPSQIPSLTADTVRAEVEEYRSKLADKKAAVEGRKIKRIDAVLIADRCCDAEALRTRSVPVGDSEDDPLITAILAVTHLRLDGLDLQTIENLECMTEVTHAYLQHNSFRCIQGLDFMAKLTVLILSHNHITVIDGVKDLEHLQFLDLSYNQIDCASPADLPASLHRLSLEGNACVQSPDYSSIMTDGLPNLQFLDDKPVANPSALPARDDGVNDDEDDDHDVEDATGGAEAVQLDTNHTRVAGTFDGLIASALNDFSNLASKDYAAITAALCNSIAVPHLQKETNGDVSAEGDEERADHEDGEEEDDDDDEPAGDADNEDVDLIRSIVSLGASVPSSAVDASKKKDIGGVAQTDDDDATVAWLEARKKGRQAQNLQPHSTADVLALAEARSSMFQVQDNLRALASHRGRAGLMSVTDDFDQAAERLRDRKNAMLTNLRANRMSIEDSYSKRSDLIANDLDAFEKQIRTSTTHTPPSSSTSVPSSTTTVPYNRPVHVPSAAGRLATPPSSSPPPLTTVAPKQPRRNSLQVNSRSSSTTTTSQQAPSSAQAPGSAGSTRRPAGSTAPRAPSPKAGKAPGSAGTTRRAPSPYTGGKRPIATGK